MRLSRLCLLAFSLLLSIPSLAQKEEWLPITQKDWDVKSVPGNPGASAIQLYYRDDINHNGQYEYEYHRIKILNESGKKYADVEILAGLGTEVKNLKARTLHPDGTIVEFSGKPFDKTVFKGRGLKLYFKTFTMPDVNVGSIIEYRYRHEWPGLIRFADTWTLQTDLYTVKEDFTFKPFEGGTANEYYWPGAQVSWVTLNLKDKRPQKKNGGVELEMENVPAFEAETYMPPEDNYKPSVRFYYTDSNIETSDKFWHEVGKNLNEAIDRFIGNHKEVKEAAIAAIGNESEPGLKLRKLYERAQQIRNLSYERERTEEERKKEKIKDNEGIAEVLRRGYGDKWDITRLFVGMARSAGFEAFILRVSDRKQMFFSKDLLSLTAMDTEIAAVNVAGGVIYLEPGAKFCPYGLLPWNHTSTTALKLDKKNPSLITVPPATFDKSLTRRTANVMLDQDGTLKGTVQVEFQGQEALQHSWMPTTRMMPGAGKTCKMSSSHGFPTELE